MKPDYYFEAPSKTFIVGEYAVLYGAPALLLNTKPCFTLQAWHENETRHCPFHPDSPAGLYYKKFEYEFKKLRIVFSDPHNGLGGFGCSSAEFLLLKKLHDAVLEKKSCPWDTLSEYKIITENQTPAPSGADVVAQFHYMTEIILYRPETKEISQLSWPFASINYSVKHTGYKIKTHESLIKPNTLPVKRMTDIVEATALALKQTDSSAFAKCIQDYEKIMDEQHLVCENTKNITQNLLLKGNIRAAKGCGTLAADVIFIFGA